MSHFLYFSNDVKNQSKLLPAVPVKWCRVDCRMGIGGDGVD